MQGYFETALIFSNKFITENLQEDPRSAKGSSSLRQALFVEEIMLGRFQRFYCGWEANMTIAEAIIESLDVQKFCE